MKNPLGIHDPPPGHWVGDGFPVRSLFSYNAHAQSMDPFLLLDFAGPAEFAPAATPRGVGQHPHRGFETVTIVYDGEVAHRDSAGNGGTIGPGDVQWMTAGGGIIHEEFHSPAYTARGGRFAMLQLWVNLPAKDKMTPPRYQPLIARDIPVAELPDGTGTLRVIAGEFRGTKGPARTFSPINVWDAKIAAGSRVTLDVPDGHTTAVIPLHGSGAVTVNGAGPAHEAQLVLLERAGTTVEIEAHADASIVVLAGEPLHEPVVGHGPFVMNTREEIARAIEDFRAGRFGEMQ